MTTMKGRRRLSSSSFILVSVLLAISGSVHAGLIVSPSSSADAADDLTDHLLGPGISLVGSPTFTGVDDQAGVFTGGSTAGFGIDQGAIMTNGDATLAAGSNSADNTGVMLGTAGDAGLDSQVSATTRDAAVLDFEFQFGDGTGGGDLFFDFIFASEEFNENVGSAFDDPIAVTIDGVNVALAPDGNSVSVNNVNCGSDGRSSGPNCAYFNNNDSDDGAAAFDTEYDGFTDVLTGVQRELGSGTHSAKLAIADAGPGGDFYFDSALLLGGGSFSSERSRPVPAPATSVLIGVGLLLLGALKTRMRDQRGWPCDRHW